MPTLRVVVSDMPRLLREIVIGSLESQDDMELAAVASDKSRLREILTNERADVLLLGCAEQDVQPSMTELLFDFPRMMVFTVTGEGRSTFLYELCPTKIALGEVSPTTLFDAIRDSAMIREWPPAFMGKRAENG